MVFDLFCFCFSCLGLDLHVGTQKIMGSSQWEISASKGMITRAGNVAFTIQHIKAILIVSQSLDTRKRPQINDLQFELGNIQVSCIAIFYIDSTAIDKLDFWFDNRKNSLIFLFFFGLNRIGTK